MRTRSGSTRSSRAIPAQTPASTPCSGSRRSRERRAAVSVAMTSSMFPARAPRAPSVAAVEPGGEQDPAEHGARDGPQGGEAEVQRADLVEQEHGPEGDDGQSGDEAG